MISGIIARVRSLWRGARRRSDVEAEMNEEFRLHVELRAQDLVRSGLAPADAIRQARREFGSTARYKDEARASRGLHLLDAFRFSWLDVKLGGRMLVKYPGLTLVGGLGMAVAIAIGAGYTAVLNTFLDPTVPLPEGDRLVALQNWDPRVRNKAMRSLHDFAVWREELKSVRDLGAHRTVIRNLVMADGTAEPLSIAEMSAAGFRVAGVQPVLGRYLLDEDEREGTPPVVVLGYDVWQRRFAADPRILGRELRIGTRIHTVVGVMPEGFAFPINHRFWIPFRADPSDYSRGEGPSISVFGRLVPGASLAEARAELAVIGRRMAAAFPETHEHLRAQVQPYTYAFSGMDDPGNATAMRPIQFLVSLLLVVVCVNVAALVYARTAVRRGEIGVRTALGASRRRVVAQLFAEALVLAVVAAAVGLGLAGVVLHQVNLLAARVSDRELPFWMDFGLSFGSVIYAVGLAALAAVITGVLPALKATGRHLQTSLQHLSARGSGMLLGRTWTFVIVGQVAFAVALLPTAGYVGVEFIRYSTASPGFPAEEYLSSLLYMERDEHEEEAQPAELAAAHESDFDARYGDRVAELMRRLRAEPGVADVTFALTIPGNERLALIEVEGGATSNGRNDAVRSGPNSNRARIARVDVGFFDAFDVPVLAGRPFASADADTAAATVIVSQSFVRQFFGDGSALGRRIRQVSAGGDMTPDQAEQRRWYEIVGVVPDFPNAMAPDPVMARLYQAATPGQIYPVNLVVRARGPGRTRLAPRLHQTAAGLDPALQLRSLGTLEAIYGLSRSAMRWMGLVTASVTLSVLLLSAAGIYAMMSFAVARRRREIGIRAALGAGPRRILASVFARAAMQLGLGIAVGLGVALLLGQLTNDEFMAGHGRILLPIVSAMMLTVGLLASIGPARRGLRIEPTEALKQE